MNMAFQGAFSTMPPRLVMRKFDMTIIRPMCLVHEADLIEMAQAKGYRKQIKKLPVRKRFSPFGYERSAPYAGTHES